MNPSQLSPTPHITTDSSLFHRQVAFAAQAAPLANLMHAGAILFVGAAILPWAAAPRVIWSAAGIVVCLLTLRWRRSGRQIRHTYLEMLIASALFGGLWTTAIAGVFASPGRNLQLQLSCVVVGVLGAGSIALSAHHSLGLAWLGFIAPPVAVVLALHPDEVGLGLLVMLVVYVLALVFGVLRLSANFRDRCRGEELAERRRADIQLRLDDFEAGARDWLWETAPDGTFVRISDRFSQMAARTARQLAAQTLPELLRAAHDPTGDDTGAAVLDQLDRCLRDGLPFSDLVLQVRIQDEPRWWSLSGRRHEGDRWRGLGSDVTESVLARRRILRLATTDPITGLPNRHDFGRELAERLRRVAPDRGLHLGIVDIDNFKAVNDTLGHPVGDLLITEIAHTLSAELREGEFCARFGGDEFVVITEGLTGSQAAQRFDDLLRAVRTQPYHVAENVLAITGSIGYAECTDPDADPTTLISSADLALYAAKNAGRDRAGSWNADMSDTASEKAAFAQELRQAVVTGEFELYWQPQVDLLSGDIRGWEGLLRWNHPRLGLLAPGRFLQLATETGDVVAIGRLVVRLAVAAVSRFPASATLSINVSYRELLSPGFVDHLVHTVEAGGIGPGQLTLEVTEDVIAGEQARQTVLALRRAGFALSMDDFGTGYSSFSSLAALRFDEIKIDRSFIRNLTGDPVHRSLVRTIISMAAALGSTVVAEGVETVEERDLLRTMGCDRIQGYLEARPVPLGEVDGLIRARV